jgi:hypothetical protein
MHQNLVYRYRMQSGNLDELHRYAPLIEAQLRELPGLKDVNLDSQLNSDQATGDAGHKNAISPGAKELPTMTLSFSLAPKVAFVDAIAQIHDMEIRVALPATITTSLPAVKQSCGTERLLQRIYPPQ